MNGVVRTMRFSNLAVIRLGLVVVVVVVVVLWSPVLL